MAMDISDNDFLERMARSDALSYHVGTTCGLCHNMILGAEVSREMIEETVYEDVASKWATETKRQLAEKQVFQAVAEGEEGWS